MKARQVRLEQIPKIKINMMDTDEGYSKTIDDVWKMYDYDNNGSLDEIEAREFLKAILREVNGATPTHTEVRRNFVKMDLDRSGEIDKEEALKYLQGMRLGLQLSQVTGTPKLM